MLISKSLVVTLTLVGLLVPRSARPNPESAPTSHVTVLAGRDEPGPRMIITGRVVAIRDSRPLAGVRVDVYQTDAKGLYDPRGGPEPRLTGSLSTDSAGRYEIRTIRPAPYPNRPIPAHLHYVVIAPDRSEHRFEVRFEDDPLTTAQERARSRRERTFGEVRPVLRGPDGILRVVRDLRLDVPAPRSSGT